MNSIFNPSISYVRVLSMLLVVVTHFLSWKEIYSFQINTVAVSAFLFISGYLYGNKEIEDNKIWLWQRIKRVLFPFWILSAFLSIYLIFNHEYLFALQSFAETMFNLQGLHSIIRIPFELGNYHISGLSHCWFLTVIIACYFLVICIKNTKIEKKIDSRPLLSLILLVLIHFAMSLLHIAVGTIIIFFVGYFFKRIEIKNILHLKYTGILFIISVLVFALRIILKRYIDDTPIYDFFIASFSSNICAVCFYLVIYQLCQFFSGFSNFIVHSRIWRSVDEMTYPIYLTHYMFLQKPFEIAFTNNTYLQIVVFTILSIGSAFILNKFFIVIPMGGRK